MLRALFATTLMTTAAGIHRVVLPREESARGRQVGGLTLPPSSLMAELAYSCSESHRFEASRLGYSRVSAVGR